MIVDLLRNDLSVYAETGSVKTPKLFEIESFNQVHHMVSEVTARLRQDINPFHVLMSALPGGSITGAPKIRAMQIIEELEGTPRGAYCGSMGYFNFDGTGSWNILIRSIQKYQNDISVWAGGGITIASDCDAEYQECFDKVSAMLDLLNTWYKPNQQKSDS
jgi:para-aminobenzoate synthetase component 1